MPFNVAKHDTDIIGVMIRYSQILISIVVQVADVHCLGVGVGRIVDRGLKRSIAVSYINADIVPIVVSDNQIQNTIIVKVANCDASWSLAARVIDRRLKSSVSFANEN